MYVFVSICYIYGVFSFSLTFSGCHLLEKRMHQTAQHGTDIQPNVRVCEGESH